MKRIIIFSSLLFLCIGVVTGCRNSDLSINKKEKISESVQNLDAKESAIKPNNEKILDKVERVKDNSEKPLETILGPYSGDKQNLLNSQSKALLDELGFKYDDIGNVDIVQENDLNRTVKRAKINNAMIDIDDSGNIVNIENQDDFSTIDKDKRDYKKNTPLVKPEIKLKSKDDLNSIIQGIEKVCDLKNYTLVENSFDNYETWTLIWYRDYGNGLVNSYDVYIAMVDAKDGSIWLFSRNNVEPNTTNPTITKEQAIDFAQPVLSRFSNISKLSTKLTFCRPDFYWEEGGPFEPANFIRLAWEISVYQPNSLTDGPTNYIYVDAVTGEILGGDTTK